MPIIALEGGKKTAPSYPYTPSGKVKIYLEASIPVDVFIASPPIADELKSTADAQRFTLISLPQQTKIPNQIFSLPDNCKDGWKLVIGNPGDKVAAVYYSVYEG